MKGTVKINQGYGVANGVTIESNGDIKTNGNLTIAGNITSSADTNREIFANVGSDNSITIGGATSTVKTFKFEVTERFVVGVATDYSKVVTNSNSTINSLPVCNSANEGEIRYIRNSNTGDLTFGNSINFKVSPGRMIELMCLSLSGGPEWVSTGPGFAD